jgi:dihydroneopterin aldolase
MNEETFGWIRVRNLAIDGVRVGIYPHEREDPRTVVFDLGLWAPITPAATSERIEDAVDYDTVATIVRDISRRRYYPLLEGLCEAVAGELLRQVGVPRVAVEVAKPDALAPGTPSIAIERSR